MDLDLKTDQSFSRLIAAPSIIDLGLLDVGRTYSTFLFTSHEKGDCGPY